MLFVDSNVIMGDSHWADWSAAQLARALGA
jgi:hypothetical protein